MNSRGEGRAPLAIIGAGAWGTALAQMLAVAGQEVRLWCRDPSLADRLERERRNPAYLPGVPLSSRIAVCREMGETLFGAGVAILAVPTHAMAGIAGAAVHTSLRAASRSAPQRDSRSRQEPP